MGGISEEYRATERWPFHVSCGGVVYRRVSEGVEFAVLYRGERFKEYGMEDSWHLPKGTLSRQETLEECARREIQEESGLKVELEGYLGSRNHAWTSTKGRFYDKTTHYFLGRQVGGDASAMDDEHDELQWLSGAEAVEKLARGPKKEEEIIKRAERLLQEGHGFF